MLPNQTYRNTYTEKYGTLRIGNITRIIPGDLYDFQDIDPSRLLTLQGAENLPPEKTSANQQVDAIVKNFPRVQRTTELQRYANFQNINLTGTTTDQLVLVSPSTRRVFLAIQNLSGVNNMFVTFGSIATTANGFKLAPGGSILLDTVVSQDDVHIICDALPCAGVLMYANKGELE